MGTRPIGGGLSRGKKRERPPDTHGQWDEETIAEHDKERGTRQKIDEPPTPFNRSPLSDSEEEEHTGVDPAEVAARLTALAADRAGTSGECDSAQSPVARHGTTSPSSQHGVQQPET